MKAYDERRATTVDHARVLACSSRISWFLPSHPIIFESNHPGTLKWPETNEIVQQFTPCVCHIESTMQGKTWQVSKHLIDTRQSVWSVVWKVEG